MKKKKAVSYKKSTRTACKYLDPTDFLVMLFIVHPLFHQARHEP